MRIIFMGTPDFAVPSLKTLVDNGFHVVGVVTAPDKPAGRGQSVQQPAVKKYALEKGLYLLQPENLKSEIFIQALKDLKADLQVVVAFRMLPEAVWNMPPEGTYNLHASLLPQYRGAAPINWAIINGERESGATVFKLKHEIDTGNILIQEKVPVKMTDTAGDLHDVLMEKGAKLLLTSVQKIEEEFLGKTKLHFTEQDKKLVSHAPKIFKQDCRIDWGKTVTEIHNLIRGLSPYPAAFTQIKNGGDNLQTLKIFYSGFEMANHSHPNGSISTDNKNFIHVYCTNGILKITDIQLEGKKRLPVPEFLKGFKIDPSAMFV